MCVEVSIGSLQPHQPGDSHVVLGAVVDVVGATVMVTEGTLVDVGGESLHPNHPGVRQVDVVVVVVVVVLTSVEVVVVVTVDVGLDVVLSSKQPHHPGVLHVAVLVAVEVGTLVEDELVVSVWLLSKYFQA